MKRPGLNRTTHFLSLLLLAVGVGCSCNGGGDDGGNGAGSLSERLDAAQEIQDPAERGEVLIEIADEYIAADASLGAKNSLDMAKDAADEINSKKQTAKRAKAYITLADRWRQISEMDECEDAYEEAEDAIKKIEDAAEKSNLLIDLARHPRSS